MRTRVCNWKRALSILLLAWSNGGVLAQSPIKNIEDNITRELKEDSIVEGHVLRLKSLRKRLNSMGSKHPSRKQFEERVKNEEELLSKRITLLTTPTPKDQEPQGELPNNPASRINPDPVDYRKAEKSEVAKSQGDSKPQMQPNPTKKLNEHRKPDSASMHEEHGQPKGLDLIHSDLSYPWINTSSLDSIGFFHGTKSMWAIQKQYDDSGLWCSSVIWEWEDNWRVTEKKKFGTSEKQILGFHPSPNFQVDGLWFAIYADPKHAKPDTIEVWGHRVSQPMRRPLENQCLCKFERVNNVKINPISFDPNNRNIALGVQGEVVLTHRNPVVPINIYQDRGVVISLDHWIQYGTIEKNLIPSNQPIRFHNGNVLATIPESASFIRNRNLYPFWRKEGPEPSEAPKWWEKRGKRVLRYEYFEGESREENANKLKILISKLIPGDMLLISPGVYSFQTRLDLKLIGTEEFPIVIQGEGTGVVFTRNDESENVINVKDSQFAGIGCIEVTGGSSGVRIQSASNLMIYNSTIHDVGNVGIALNSHDTSAIYIVDNEIFGTRGHGEGIYAGSHDGASQTNGSFFVGNYIHDLASDPDSQGDGIEIKNRSYNNTVKWNYISETRYPGITIYTAGEHTKDPNKIIENVVVDSMDSGIQATGDALIQNNWISGKMTGISSKPFGNLQPRNLSILGNTVLTDTHCIKAKDWYRSDILVVNNFMFSKNRNYLHSGFGKALYFANQLSCELPAEGTLGSIVATSSNRLVPRNDIFGQIRSERSSIGAIEYNLQKVESSSINRDQKPFKFAIFNPVEGQVSFYDEISSDARFRRNCVTEDRGLVKCETALLYIDQLPSDRAQGKTDMYRVRIIDPLKGVLYESSFENLSGNSLLSMKTRMISQKEITGIGVSASSNLILVHPSVVYTLPSR